MITLDAKRYMVNGLYNNISHVLCYVGDEEIRLNIYKKTISNDTLEVRVYLDDTIKGRVYNFRIVDDLETSLFTPNLDFVKSDTSSLLLSFEINGIEVITNDYIQ